MVPLVKHGDRPISGVKKCGMIGCGCCEDILEVKSFYFRNSGITFEIKTPMNCTARNLVYVIQCKGCGYTYIGETVNFRHRMSAHKSNSASPANAVREVSRHLYTCGKGFWRCPLYKVKEESNPNSPNQISFKNKPPKHLPNL